MQIAILNDVEAQLMSPLPGVQRALLIREQVVDIEGAAALVESLLPRLVSTRMPESRFSDADRQGPWLSKERLSLSP